MALTFSTLQGLLSALGAAVRAKIRQAAGTQSLLTIKARRERTVAALQQAALAIDAAAKLAKGKLVKFCGCFSSGSVDRY